MKLICFIILLILISGCSSNFSKTIVNKDIVVEGKIFTEFCDGKAKCIDKVLIYPGGYSFDYHDYEKIREFNNKTVIINGDLISEVRLYSCEKDYFDRLQHPSNPRCVSKSIKYYQTKEYLKINTIELIG